MERVSVIRPHQPRLQGKKETLEILIDIKAFTRADNPQTAPSMVDIFIYQILMYVKRKHNNVFSSGMITLLFSYCFHTSQVSGLHLTLSYQTSITLGSEEGCNYLEDVDDLPVVVFDGEGGVHAPVEAVKHL